MRSLTLTLAIAIAASPAHARDTIVVIVNPATPVAHVEAPLLKTVYMGGDASIGGAPAAAASYPEAAPLRQAFEREVMQTDPTEISKYWKSQRFLGFGDNEPVTLNTSADVKKFVARQRGAIGFIPASHVDPSVTVVGTVNGHTTAESAKYPYAAP